MVFRAGVALIAALHAGSVDKESRRIAELLLVRESVDQELSTCEDGASETFRLEYENETKTNRLGVPAGSEFWNRIKNAYQAFYRSSCTYTTPREAEAIFSASLAGSLSLDQKVEIIEFLSSAAGQALSRAFFEAGAEYRQQMSKRVAGITSQAQRKFESDMDSIVRDIEKYRTSPDPESLL